MRKYKKNFLIFLSKIHYRVAFFEEKDILKNMRKMKSKKSVRLSKNATPIKYDIQIRPDLENFTFEGKEVITLFLTKKTKTLTLHSKELEIETARVEELFGKISYDQKRDTVTFSFAKTLPVGKIKLMVFFKGILNDKMRGFYRSKYHILGKEHYLATTQFEATDARRAFPCFDEPAHKAVFHVSLIVLKGQTAISNTLPVSVSEHDSKYQIVKFAPTPKMSTYLLAFIVGNFEHIESKTKNGIKVRVFTTPGKKHQAKFALDCAVKTLEFYEKYFDIAYPLPILDMIAIPDFTAGAMENWGAITYRESALLVDENHSSLSNKQWVALVIAHEIAHQWFGNLVTMEWWTHLWLNEGFASYIEYLAVDKLFPKWDIWTQFVTNELSTALRLDSLLNTHPIEIPVHHPDEIGEIFDEVSYSKGASVIRMLADYLGEKDFRDGLRYYLKKHSYKNTETLHLWQAFEKVSKKPVAQIMHNWTSKGGYPVVTVETKNGKLNLSQKRFFLSAISQKKCRDRTSWRIPATIDFQKSWMKVNIGEAGFYRTAYSKEFLERLKAPVEKKLLSPSDRVSIVRDLFALAEAGIIPTTETLEFLPSYKDETNYTVWLELASGLSRLEQLLAKSGARKDLDELVVKLFSPLVKSLGWEKKKHDSHTDALLRSLAISRAGRAGNKKIIKEAKKKFISMQKGKHTNPDIRGAVYSIVAKWGGEKDYKAMIKQYKKESMHEEKNRIGASLGDFTDPKILKKTCEFSFSKYVRTQDVISILSYVGLNPAGRDVWLNFIKKNWKTLVTRYGDGGHTLARLVKVIGGSAEKKHFRSFKKFFSTHQAPGAKRAIEQVLERMENNIAWLERDGKAISRFFKHSI